MSRLKLPTGLYRLCLLPKYFQLSYLNNLHDGMSDTLIGHGEMSILYFCRQNFARRVSCMKLKLYAVPRQKNIILFIFKCSQRN